MWSEMSHQDLRRSKGVVLGEATILYAADRKDCVSKVRTAGSKCIQQLQL